MDPIYGYEAVNVEAQTRDPSSLLNWMKRMLAVRKTQPARSAAGGSRFLRPGNRKILAYLREYGDDAILCVANLARSAQPVELDLARFKGRVPVEMLGRTAFPPIGELPYLLTLPAHGFYWFRLAADAEVPHWHEERLAREDLPVARPVRRLEQPVPRPRRAVAHRAWRSAVRAQLEREVLPRYLESQRWYAAKGETRRSACALADHALWERRRRRPGCSRCSRSKAPAEPATYFVPLALAWEDTDEERTRAARPGDDRQGAPAGAGRRARRRLRRRRVLPRAGRRDRRRQGDRHRARQAALHADARVSRASPATTSARCRSAARRRRAATPSSRSATASSSRCYRRLRPGTNLELEIGRFLTEVARFPNCVPVAGRARIHRTPTARATDARAAAGLRRQPGRRLGLHGRTTSSAICEAAAHRARSRLPRTRTARYLALISDARPCARPSCTSRSRRARAIPRSTRSR